MASLSPPQTRRFPPRLSWRWPARRQREGAAALAIGLALMAALGSYRPDDPSFSNASGVLARNLLGAPGAGAADLMFQLCGFAALAAPLLLLRWGWLMLADLPLPALRLRLCLLPPVLLLLSAGLGLLLPAAVWPVSTGAGGLAGWAAQRLWTEAAAALAGAQPWMAGAPLALLGLAGAIGLASPRPRAPAAEGRPDAVETAVEPPPRRRPPARQSEPAAVAVERSRIAAPKAESRPGARVKAEAQTRLNLGDSYALPPLTLLSAAARAERSQIDKAALEHNARMLESVLDDYGVKGEIIQVRPGPVVTLYELEPAPGVKSSRVIGLTDDIARSMSAISARVAVVPGRNVIGIELPNARREAVGLRELLASEAFETPKRALPLVLGKDIAGEPIIADLAPMPHLLIAGTTGSGKSVGLNAMIVSLLYRLTPDELRFIMIDPKMLELSVYDGIPHLLAPVVTEPKKAITALRWTVREMETRYQKMSAINAKSLAGFNEKVREAKARNQPLIRRVLTGYDDDREPVYEEQRFNFEPLPMIVVVVDELADLMIVAGKEVEVLIQRVAQKARAAGIHLIMATQRPSVDVITGVIKANLPTRISFQVTSKIDSRTILGEQGAEQLLGKGDMLFMASGKQATRVHGPFVSETEVEHVADHWRTQGKPDYVPDVTEGGEEADAADGLAGAMPGTGDGDGEDDVYRQAVQVVAESQKASTSYLQRRLRLGYNSAARLIERMENEGLVSAPDHVGRRQLFIDKDGNRN